MNKIKNSAIIILAAGESKRLGKPKQLLDVKGVPLINKVLKEAIDSGLSPVITILGSSAELIQKTINTRVHIVINDRWSEGMSSSIKLGIETAINLNTSLDGIVIAVCDQPFISSSLIKKIFDEHQTSGSPIVASSYRNTSGTPAYFHSSVFPELLRITGDSGAKKIVEKDPARVSLVPFPQGSIDIDTIDDYNNVRGIL